MTTRFGFAFAAAAISGFAVFVNSYGVRTVADATVYTTAKNLVAALLLVGIFAWTRRAHQPAQRPRWTGAALIAVIGGSVPFVLFFEGLARASSTHAALLHKTLFLWVAPLAVLLLKERLRLAHAVAAVFLAGGLLALDGGLLGLRLGDGELLIGAAALLWAVEVVVAKRLLGGVAPASLALARMGGGVILLLGWLAITGRLPALLALDGQGWAWSAATGVILAGYVLTWYTALSRAQAVDVTAILVAAAALTGLLNVLVKGTPIGVLAGAGWAMVTAGAAIVALSQRRAPALERLR